MSRNHAPYRSLQFLKWFCPPSLYESIEGDLLQQFEDDVSVRGLQKARRQFTLNVLRFFQPEIILRNHYTLPAMRTVLLLNYIKISFRNLRKHSSFSAITIFGLAISMSLCLISIMSIRDQLGYDTFHPHTERTFRIITEVKNQSGEKFRLASTPLPLAAQLEKEYQVTERTVQLYPALSDNVRFEKREFSLQGAFTDPAFFHVFGFDLESGDKYTALNDVNSIVLSKATAVKFFGKVDPLGQTLTMDKFGSFVVTGVLKPSAKSHISYDVYVPMARVAALEDQQVIHAALDEWNVIDVAYTYALIPEHHDRDQLDAALAQISDKLTASSEGKGSISFETQALNRITPGKEELQNDITRGQSWAGIAGVAGVTLIILLSACFNYTNLSLARSLSRGKEVGIRKLVGARRRQLFSQFIIESVLLSLIAVAIAYQILQLMIHYAPFSSEVIPDIAMDMKLIISFIAFGLVTGVIAGIIPAWLLSSLQPARVLKSLSNIKLLGGFNLHKSLLIFQFGLSLVLVILVSVTYKQFNYMATASYGFKKDNLISISLNHAEAQPLSNALLQLSGVKQVSATSAKLGKHTSGRVEIKKQQGEEGIETDYYFVDQHFISTMGLTLLEGRSFPDVLSSDKEEYIMINEQVLKKLKISKEEAIGTNVIIDTRTKVQVIGVLKDFNYKSLSFSIQPMMLRYHPDAFAFVQIEINQGTDKEAIIKNIEQIYTRLNPGQVFSYSWFDQELYEQNAAWSTVSLLGFLAFMTSSIACLGLLGMVVYTARTRKKEMSIRKVMGADVIDLIVLLSRSFMKLLFIAGGVALPFGYVLGILFLQLFAYHVSIDPFTLMGGFLALLLIGLVTISSQTIKTARVNPTDNLRSE